MIAPSNEQRRSPLSGVIASATEVAGDFVELAELQIELAKLDANKFVSRSIPSIGGALASSVMLLVCLPVGLLGLADFLATQFNYDLGITRIAIGFIGGVFAIALLTVCLLRLKSSFNAFTNSQDQLRQNAIWLKKVIRRN